jgi:hypothetical protein
MPVASTVDEDDINDDVQTQPKLNRQKVKKLGQTVEDQETKLVEKTDEQEKKLVPYAKIVLILILWAFGGTLCYIAIEINPWYALAFYFLVQESVKIAAL